MIFGLKQWDEWCKELVAKYKVENKDLGRQERIQGRKLPRLRWMKLYLYSKKMESVYFPIGQFNSLLKPKSEKKLSEKISYKTTTDPKVLEAIKDLVYEQEDILADIWINNMRTGLIEMKTWRGKGNLIIKLCEHFQEKTLILVHNIKTLEEMKEKFEKFSDYSPWVYYSKKKKLKEITITTHKSFVLSHAEFKGKFSIIIYDEADVNLSDKMIRSLILADVEGLFWLTWTPYRQELSTQDLTLIFWPHLRVSGQENNGYNIIPKIYRLKYTSDDFFSFENFHDLKEQLINNKKRLDSQIKFIKKAYPKIWAALLLVDRIVECSTYCNALKEAWIPTCIVNGKTNTTEDNKNIKDMVDKKWIIVATSGKMSRWVDIPAIDSVFLFYPNRYQWSTVQAVWRSLRTFPWKDKVRLFDRCDLPILRWQADHRLATYKKEYPWCFVKNISL